MKWHVYKKEDSSTWPRIDCPMLLVSKYGLWNAIYAWNDIKHCFQNKFTEDNYADIVECYYAYIGYVPSGYKTHYPIVCTCQDCPQGYDDNGYCMDYDNDYACGCKKEVAEYSIEEKRIWKEFE